MDGVGPVGPWMVFFQHGMVIEVEDRYEMMTSPVRTKNIKTHYMNRTIYNLNLR